MIENTQERLDQGTDMLAKLAKLSAKAAVEACEAGDADNAALLHEVCGHVHLALAAGRKINLGGIQPKFGGK